MLLFLRKMCTEAESRRQHRNRILLGKLVKPDNDGRLVLSAGDSYHGYIGMVQSNNRALIDGMIAMEMDCGPAHAARLKKITERYNQMFGDDNAVTVTHNVEITLSAQHRERLECLKAFARMLEKGEFRFAPPPMRMGFEALRRLPINGQHNGLELGQCRIVLDPPDQTTGQEREGVAILFRFPEGRKGSFEELGAVVTSKQHALYDVFCAAVQKKYFRASKYNVSRLRNAIRQAAQSHGYDIKNPIEGAGDGEYRLLIEVSARPDGAPRDRALGDNAKHIASRQQPEADEDE